MSFQVHLDPEPGFVRADGTISHHDLYDYLHLTQKGIMFGVIISFYVIRLYMCLHMKIHTNAIFNVVGYDRAFEPVNDLLLQLLAEYEGDSVRTEAEGACAD